MNIRMSNFTNPNEYIDFMGKITSKDIKKQGFVSKRTIGGKIKQKWTTFYHIIAVQIDHISDENYTVLENLFMRAERVLVEEEGGITQIAYITSDALGFSEFQDIDGRIYYTGSITLET